MISVCMIVRDEADCVGQALASVAGIADEICVVDTGSVDGTKSICLADEKVRLLEVPWNDDFAAARNESLAMAQEPWILILDADEWVVPHAPVRQCVESYSEMGGFFVGIYSALPDRVDYSEQIRIFQNHPDIRYEGRSHAEVGPSIERAGLSTLSGIPVGIVHEGYLPHHMSNKRKVERNLRIQRKQLAEDPDNPYVLFNFGRTCVQAGDIEVAEGYLRSAKKLAPPDAPYMPRLDAILAVYRAATARAAVHE